MPRRNRQIKHQPFEFRSNCQSKRRYATEAQAQDSAEEQMLMKPSLELSAYKCELCAGWHITRNLSR